MAAVKHSYRLLIVDDDVTDRRFYSRLLAERIADGMEVLQASDGAAGLAALRAQKPDCVLLDFHLPDMTGFDFVGSASVDGELPCAVVLVTGQGNEALAVEAMKRGVEDYLVKDNINEVSLWHSVTAAVIHTELRQRLAVATRDLTKANAALEQEAVVRMTAEAQLQGAKRRAERASKAKSRFLAGMSHELRTPLNCMLGCAQLLDIQGSLNDTQKAHVAAMLGAGAHLLKMISSVLDISAIELEHVELHEVDVELSKLIAACLDQIRPAADVKHLALRCNIAFDTPSWLATDPTKLRQILLNLLGNAVKFTNAGEVQISAGLAPDRATLRIEVVDSGPGIPASHQQYLFKEFERLDAEAVRPVEGAGLGLALSARLAALMGGRLGYDDWPGGGSVFWLELPYKPTSSPTMAAAADGGLLAATMPRRQLSILVVDDIAMNRDIAGAFLRADGHEVVCVEGGAEAVAATAKERFDVVMMDVRMPNMDGLEAARRIRALGGLYGQVPIVALTAQVFSEQIAECRKAGMDSHVSKPYTQKALVAAALQAAGPLHHIA